MSRTLSDKPLRWHKIQNSDRDKAETFLRERENFCVAASARFLHMNGKAGHVWYMGEDSGGIRALLIHHRRTLYPVFNGHSKIPQLHFLNRFLGKVKIHALQGLGMDTELLESQTIAQGYIPIERIEYDLMSLDGKPLSESFGAGPSTLVLRPPLAKDREDLYALQSAYEREEVLPSDGIFNPAASRLNLEQILEHEKILVAELDGRAVGKINTSAESFTRYMIGGVYVHPAYRGRGIGLKMTAVFIRELAARGKGATLFVKKNNAAARKVYSRAGFTVLANYRISYY